MENQTQKIQSLISNNNKCENQQEILANCDLPELTDTEMAELILQAREKKAYEIKKAEYWAKVRAEAPKPTKEQFLSFCFERWKNRHGYDFLVDAQNESIFEKLSGYFYGEIDAIHTDLSQDKGILIFGGVGTGKTAIMRFFCDNPMNSFFVVPASDIAQVFQRGGFDGKEGFEGLNIFTEKKLNRTYAGNFKPRQAIGICIDDMGIEPVPSVHYGNSVNVVSHILQSRYTDFEYFGNKTHITTNLDSAMIEQVYGQRVRSRMAEMFNILKLQGNDRRRSK
jgi:DNA replication protein DnaC